jgi:hypothetical protein
MEEDDPNMEEALILTYEIIQLIEQNIQSFNDEETQEVLTSNETIQFFLDNNNTERALIEATKMIEQCLSIYTKQSISRQITANMPRECGLNRPNLIVQIFTSNNI